MSCEVEGRTPEVWGLSFVSLLPEGWGKAERLECWLAGLEFRQSWEPCLKCLRQNSHEGWPDQASQGAGRAWDQAGSPGTGVAMWAAMQRQEYE